MHRLLSHALSLSLPPLYLSRSLSFSLSLSPRFLGLRSIYFPLQVTQDISIPAKTTHAHTTPGEHTQNTRLGQMGLYQMYPIRSDHVKRGQVTSHEDRTGQITSVEAKSGQVISCHASGQCRSCYIRCDKVR
jgi:hypothetical protein